MAASAVLALTPAPDRLALEPPVLQPTPPPAGWRPVARAGPLTPPGRWGARPRHAACDVWLLTEVPAAFALDDGELMRSEEMSRTGGRSWAAIWSVDPLVAFDQVHPASVLARRDGTTLCSSVLPWRSARRTWPDEAANTAGRTVAALDRLRPALLSPGPVVWGGDWNHAMQGREYAGSRGGRVAILELVAEAGLQVPTADQPHRIDGLLSIDHIAVSGAAGIASTTRIVAAADGRRLSDHDAYVVEVLPA